mgnify:CR=1 FL=1
MPDDTDLPLQDAPQDTPQETEAPDEATVAANDDDVAGSEALISWL